MRQMSDCVRFHWMSCRGSTIEHELLFTLFINDIKALFRNRDMFGIELNNEIDKRKGEHFEQKSSVVYAHICIISV